MFAVIDSKGRIRAASETKEGAFAEMETLPDYHPLDDKEVIDLQNLPEHLTDDQKYGVLRYLVPEKNTVLRNFLEDLITDHEWYKECMNPQLAEEEEND